MTLDAESDPFEALVPKPSAAPSSAGRVSNPFEASAPNASPASVPAAPAPSGDPFEALVPKPGVWGTLKESGRRGLAEGLTSAAQGFTPFEDRPAKLQGQDQVSQLLVQPISKGWNDPKWWASHIAYGTAANSPSLAAGAAGAYLGSAAGPWGTLGGGAAGFAGGTALQTLAPAYQKARQEGLDHEKAVDQAIKESGISAAFAAAMGLAPGVSVFGKTTEGALRRPISDALAQIFGVQPGLGIGQTAAIKAYEGKGAITPEEAAQAYAEQAGVGVAFVGSHALISGGPRATGLGRKASEESLQEPVAQAAEPATAEDAYSEAPESIRKFYEFTKNDSLPKFFTPAERQADPFEALVPEQEARKPLELREGIEDLMRKRVLGEQGQNLGQKQIYRPAEPILQEQFSEHEKPVLNRLEEYGLREHYDGLSDDEKSYLQDRVSAGENPDDVLENLAVHRYNNLPAITEEEVRARAVSNYIPGFDDEANAASAPKGSAGPQGIGEGVNQAGRETAPAGNGRDVRGAGEEGKPQEPEVEPQGQPVIENARQQIMDAIGPLLPKGVDLNVVDRILTESGDEAWGKRVGRLIDVSLAAGNKAVGIGRHEIIHVLREGKFFTEPEWRLLLDRAPDLKPQDSKRYRAINRKELESRGLKGGELESRLRELMNQERVAKVAEAWENGRNLGSKTHEVFQRTVDFIKAIGNALRGLGFKTSDQVMRDVMAGEVSRRAVFEDGQPQYALAGKSGKSKDVIQFLRSRGGIRPSGETKAMDAGRIPGLISNNGMRHDQAREALAEAGYIREDPNAPPTTSVADFHDLLDRAVRGERIIAEGSHGAEQERIAKEEAKADRSRMEREAIDAAKDAGIKNGYDALKRDAKLDFHERIARGEDPNNALSAASNGSGGAGKPPSGGGSSNQPPSPPSAGGFVRTPDGPLGRFLHGVVERFGLGDAVRDLQMAVTPMAARDAIIISRAAAKDYANYMRRVRWESFYWDNLLKKEFKPEELKSMWEAGDEESVLRQQGQDTTGKGLSRLTPKQRKTVQLLQRRADEVYAAAKAVGIVDADAAGLPSYMTRMIVMAGEGGFKQPTKQRGGLPLDAIGRDLITTTPNVRGRKHLTVAETEAAAKAKFGEDAQVVRDIRTLNIATSRLQQAVAGKSLINRIKEIGRQSGDPTVYEGTPPTEDKKNFFTLPQHPCFWEWKPKLKEGSDGKWHAVLDENGKPFFVEVPLWVRRDFEGPLRAVLSQDTGAVYKALMALKINSVGLIMYSPLIHNAVEFARALPIMPGKMLSLKVYRDGFNAKRDFNTMREFLYAGGVPIGDWRGHGGDAAEIMNEPDRTADKGWLTRGLRRYAGDLPADVTGKALNFWHQTLLWDRIADLQMGLYTNLRDKMIADGRPRDIATKAAAHYANRYAGAVPMESMSAGARKLANLTMFSRSFTVGNLGVMKDIFMGLPSDVQAQIIRDHGFEQLASIKSAAKRKAISAFMLDTALFYVSNSLLQDSVNAIRNEGDPMLDGYARRLKSLMGQVQENPFIALNPFLLASKLSATSDNEPGKQDRVNIYSMSNGTAIYLRNLFGKLGEEFTGYATAPISMFNKKQSTILRPIMQTLSNDQGFGRKVYNPNAETPDELLRNAAKIAWHFVSAQTPELALTGLSDLAAGRGNEDTRHLAAAQVLGPLLGLQVSKGFPGGPAKGELFREKQDFEYRFKEARPDIVKLIQAGDFDGAMKRMDALGVSSKDQKSFIRHTQNPGKISKMQIRDFKNRGSPEQLERFERDLNQHANGGKIKASTPDIENFLSSNGQDRIINALNVFYNMANRAANAATEDAPASRPKASRLPALTAPPASIDDIPVRARGGLVVTPSKARIDAILKLYPFLRQGDHLL